VRAVEYLHSGSTGTKICHGDISLVRIYCCDYLCLLVSSQENLLVHEREGKIIGWLSNFDTLSEMDPSGTSSTLVRTYGTYPSPECFTSESHKDRLEPALLEKGDVWALGMTIYHVRVVPSKLLLYE
jgi:hypothetical protein